MQRNFSMPVRPRLSHGFVVAAAVALPAPAFAQSRSSDNAVTQAEDAFGFSVGRESLGIYSAGYARGFSPTSAGNVRINGLYFDPANVFAFPAGIPSTLLGSTSVKVGLSAQGYPFAAPSGIVDQSLRLPTDKNAASVVTNFDSFGSIGTEVDGSYNASDRLAFAYGVNLSHVEFPDGTNNFNHTESLLARWRPAPGIEIVPFWYLYNDYNDEAGVFFVPAGEYLPLLPKPRRFEGASWGDYRFTDTGAGVLASASLAKNWLFRLGAFRIVNDQKAGFTNLLDEEMPDGTGERLLFADPPQKSTSISGEARLTHSIPDGPRLHVIHVSLRERDAHREFGGSALLDLGPGRIGENVDAPRPATFDFGELSRQHLTQTTFGVAYDGRWKNVGEISFSISKAHYRKTTDIPGETTAISRSTPWLYNGTAALSITRAVSVYVGYARGLEESGVAPPNAANRNAPLPTILTSQKDAGVRVVVGGFKIVGGLFDLKRPYFGFDSANIFKQVGSVESRGAEFSISGSVTPNLNLVAGGVLIDGKVTRDAGVPGVIGSKPVGLSPHQLSLNANWKTPFKGLELDTTLINRAPAPSTTDNLVYIPAKWRWDVGTHYHFKLAKRDATFRLQLFNITGKTGYGVAGSGIYSQNPGRFVQGYLAVDF
jgi:iron complex outermembrane receptor protein